MDFRILGPLEALDEGLDVAPAGSKLRALLALLLLHANETLPTDRLVDELWGEHPPATAPRTLQAHVSRLRKALDAGAGNGPGGMIVTREHGYQLKLDPERLDGVSDRTQAALWAQRHRPGAVVRAPATRED